MRNTIPVLFDAIRPTLRDVASWVGVSRALTRFWRDGAYLPTPKRRVALVKAIRSHAARLLALADQIEREGTASQAMPTRRQPVKR